MTQLLKTSHLPWIAKRSRGKPAALLSDPDKTVVDRCEAALRLGKAGGENAFWALVEAAYDVDFWIRAEVVRALARVEDPRAFPILLDLLDDPEALVRFETRDAIRHIQSRLDVKQQYDLLLQVEEGSARAKGPFHVTASPTDIGLHVMNNRLLQGYGIDIYMDVHERRIGLHAGRWEFDSPGEHRVSWRSTDPETGIALLIRIECTDREFRIAVDGQFPEPAKMIDPTCNFIFIDPIKGRPLLPANGLLPGPTRRAMFGNEILMRRTEKAGWLAGITLDITGSEIFRRIVVNPDVNVPLIQLTPTQPGFDVGPGQTPLLRALLTPHPNPEDFEEKRVGYLQRQAVSSGNLTARVIGKAFRLERGQVNLLESYGLYVDVLSGETHCTSFRHPMTFQKIDDHRLAADFAPRHFPYRVSLTVESRPDGRIAVLVRDCRLGAQADRLKVGLLLKRTYTEWKAGETWAVFAASSDPSDSWVTEMFGDVGAKQEFDFRQVSDLDLPALHVRIAGSDSGGLQYALKSTDIESNNARALEILLPGGNPTGSGPEFLIEVCQ